MGPSLEVRRNRALVDLALALRRLKLSAFTREVVRSTREVLGAEYCKVLECAGSESRAGHALFSKPSVVGGSDRGSRFEWATLLRHHGFISAAIRANGRTFGILSVYSASRGRYTEEEAVFVRDAAELLGMAAERALSEGSHLRALEKERRRADAAEERYAFLHEANVVLAAIPNGLTALSAAARLAVPALADWCFVDLVEEDGAPPGRIRRFAAARPEGGKSGGRSARELTYHYPLDPNAPHGTPKVLRTGQPELIPEVRGELLQSLSHDGEYSELMRSLTPGSYLCVPLQVGFRLVGSMGFVSSAMGCDRSVRRYGSEDLVLAEAFARCTALVLANVLEGFFVPDHVQRSSEPASHRQAISSPYREPGLTPRQLEVLRLLDRGMRAQQIKAELNLSEPTVRTHIRAILRAFGACSQLEALHKARTLGVVDGAVKDAASDRF